jgi:methyl-accepting chemotaxis protein
MFAMFRKGLQPAEVVSHLHGNGAARNMRIATTSRVMGAIVTAAFVVMVGLGWAALGELKVGGPVYQRIVNGKDLIADVAPPPVYLVQAYLETNLINNEPWSLEPRRKRLAELRKAYDERIAFWGKQNLNAAVRNQLLAAAHAPAERFWEATEQRFLPALDKGDRDMAGDAFLAMKEAFEEHHAAILNVVAEANRLNAALEAEAVSVERLIMLVLGALALAILGIVVGCIFCITRWFVQPVVCMTGEMTKLAGGNLAIDLSAGRRKDEIGDMAKAVAVFRHAAEEKLRLERKAEEERVRNEELRRQAEQDAIARERAAVESSIGTGLARLAAKDLTYRMTADLPEAYAKLQSDFNAALEQLEQAVLGVGASVQMIDTGTAEIASASDNLARRTEQQAANLEETSAALAEITVTVNKAAEGAVQARQVVATAHDDAAVGGEVVRKAVEAVGGIEKSARQISQITGVIDEIAFQTNLLALNAGVEAARAGDAGRGFAVVAVEVRALAKRSADAAKQIKELISTSAAQVDRGVKLVGETGEALSHIVGNVTHINSAIADIASGAQEQAVGLKQVNVAVNDMDKMTQQNAAMAEQAMAAGQTLAREASRLSQLVDQFLVGRHSADGEGDPMERAA